MPPDLPNKGDKQKMQDLEIKQVTHFDEPKQTDHAMIYTMKNATHVRECLQR